VRPSAITARTALYLCSVTLNSLMRWSVRYQPDTCLAQPSQATGITRDAFVVLQPDQHSGMVLAENTNPEPWD